MLAFEYQGIQHYQEDPHFHRTPTAFQEQQQRDAKKLALCADNVAVIVIPYWEYKKGVGLLMIFIAREIIRLGYAEDIVIDLKTLPDLEQEVLQSAFTGWEGADLGLRKLRDILATRGYTLLTTFYAGRLYRYRVRCDNDHEYEATGDTILDPRGRGCGHPDCNGKPVITDDVVRDFAIRRGFEFTGAYNAGSGALISFRCILGHDIMMSWDNFKQYKNCAQCFGRDASCDTKATVLRRYAERYGGTLVAHSYTNRTEKLLFRCECGKDLNLSAMEVLRGTWCACKR